MARRCKDCKYLRHNVRQFDNNATLPKQYGNYTSPCNRFPQNIMRSPEEPACGEFKKRWKFWQII